MCLLAICDSKSLPKEEFYEAFRINSDGFGFAWRTNKIQFVKGIMDIDKAWEIYSEFTNKNIYPHVIHFRLGSPKEKELTHPFIVSEDSELVISSKETKKIEYDSVLFHNGIVTGWKDMMINTFLALKRIPEGDLWSDTRVVAIMVKILGPEILDFINGKFVLFSMDDIIVSGDFSEDKELEGIRFSNNSYKVTRSVTVKKYSYSRYTGNESSNVCNLFSNFEKMKGIDEFII